METSFLYPAARSLVRAALAIYFRKIEISGAEHIPSKGPVIFASNHPQSVTDALVLAAGTPRAVHFLAHAGLFKNRLRGWMLRACEVIPVYRPRDSADAPQRAGAPQTTKALHKNVAMFSACERVLEEGGAIGIFPEGVSTDERRVHKLKTGTARIALDTEEKNGWRLGVTIVPVGLNFESRRRMRTRVLVTFGEPIAPARFREAYEKDPVEAVGLLSTALEEAIARLVVDIERPEFEELVREVDWIYRGELISRRGLEIAGRSKFESGHLVSIEIPRVLDFFLERQPEVVWRVRRLLEDYRRSLDTAQIRDEMLRDAGERTVGGEIARLAGFGVLGLAPALYGMLWSFVPYKFAGFFAHGAAKDETKIHYSQIVCGALLFPLWYAPPVYLVYRGAGEWGAAAFAATLPLSGLFALGYVRWFIQRGRMVRFAWLRMTHGRFVQELERKRQLVIREMDVALAEYLGAQLDPAPETPEGEEGQGE